MATFPIIIDRSVQYPNRFELTDSSGKSTVVLDPDPGAGEPGSELNAALFNAIKAYIDAGDDFPTVPVNKGGTGTTSLTSNRLLCGSGTNPVSSITAGTSGQLLQSAGSGKPTWASVADSAAASTIMKRTSGGHAFAATPGTAQGDTALVTKKYIDDKMKMPNNGYIVPGTSGYLMWCCSDDGFRVNLRGNIYFDSANAAWGAMVAVPGLSGYWGYKVPAELYSRMGSPLYTEYKYISAIGQRTVSATWSPGIVNRATAALGTDGNIYLDVRNEGFNTTDPYALWVTLGDLDIRDLA